MNDAIKFKLHIAPIKPGDFGPIGYAVYSPTGLVGTVIIYDGAIVEPIGPITVDGEGIAFRTVRLESGWTGRVCWHEFDGWTGFEPV